MSDDLKENVMDTNIWLRLVFMLLFAVIFGATRLILVTVVAIQFLWVLFSGNRNKQLLSFANQLATFIYQIYRYLSFNTETRPFPFGDFPSDEALIDEPEEAPAASESAAEVDVVAEEEAPAKEEPVEQKEEAPKKAPVKRRKPAAKKTEEEKPAGAVADAADEGEKQ